MSPSGPVRSPLRSSGADASPPAAWRPRPIGAIVFDLDKALGRCGTEDAERNVMDRFDRTYGGRVDYRLWRATKRAFARGRTWRYLHPTGVFPDPLANPSISFQALYDELGDRPGQPCWRALEQWGLVAVFAAHANLRISEDTTIAMVGTRANALRVLERVNEIQPLPELPWGCVIAAIIARAKLVDHLLSSSEKPDETNRDDVERAIQDSLAVTCATLRTLDPAFHAGGPVPLKRIETEEEKGRRLVPLDTITHAFNNLAWALEKLAREGQQRLSNSPSRGWTSNVFAAACTAWRIRRWQRLAAEKLQYENFRRRLDALYFKEMSALSYAAKAALVAGEVFKSAGLHWAFQILYASRAPVDPFNGRMLRLEDWQFAAVRQAGIEPIRPYKNPAWRTEPRIAADRAPLGPPAANVPVPEMPQRRPHRRSTLEQSVHDHRDQHPEVWLPLDGVIRSQADRFGGKFQLNKAIGSVGEHLEKEAPKDEGGRVIRELQPLVRSLFRIFHDCGFARSMMNMLHCLDAVDVEDHLLPAARMVSECVRINQVAVSSKFMDEFLERITHAWGRCTEYNIPLRDRLLLHELVLGRYSGIYSSVSSIAYRELLKNRLDDKEEPGYARILNAKEDAFRLGPDALTVEDLEEFVSNQSPGGVGAPIMVSVIALASGASVVAYGKRIGLRGYFDAEMKLDEPTQCMLQRREAWFRAPDEICAPHNQIAWSKEHRALRDRIIELAKENGSRWIMLAVDHEQTCLPWQHLFSFAGNDLPKTWLVTLCPNLGWATMMARREPAPGPEDPARLICQSTDPAVVQARQRISHLLAPELQDFDTGVVLGHGLLPPYGAPEIKVGDDILGLDDFCLLNRHQVAVVHSCWTGSARAPQPWGHGMLISHLLGRNCQSAFAPVGLVSPEAIEALQRSLTGGEKASLGVRYLRAIAAHPSVSLYNLHGLGSTAPRCRAARPADPRIDTP